MLHTNNPIIKHKAGLLNLAEELQNVSRACKIMGVSRDTFYRYQELVETDGLEGLINRERRVPNLKNRVDGGTEQAVINHAIDFPAHGQHRTSNELRKRGVFVSGSGVRSIWLRHKLENFKCRLKALEAKVANEGIALSDGQIAALERKHEEDVACGEIETAHPGYLGAQDTFYVGNLKGVGRIYQQTFIDTYSKVVHCKLYTTKTPITAADVLNDKRCCRFMPATATACPCCASSQTVARSIAARWNSTITSFIWPSMTLTTPRPRPCHRRPTASVNGFVRPFCRSFTKSRSARSFMGIWIPCRKTWTNGSFITIMKEPIKAKCATAERRWKHCSVGN